MDLWSAGVVMYVTLCGFFPFNEDTDIHEQIMNDRITFTEHPWSEISTDGNRQKNF